MRICKIVLISIIVVLCIVIGYVLLINRTYKPQEGDVIFHMSKSSQSEMIQKGTCSIYSHCGIIVMRKGVPYVLEAENGVELTELKKWISRGQWHHHYRIMRPWKDVSSKKIKYKTGAKYDKDFLLDNGKYYCSELVWDIYKKQYDMSLATPRPMWTYPAVIFVAHTEQFKKRGFQLSQRVVAPATLTHSCKLRTVKYGFVK